MLQLLLLLTDEQTGKGIVFFLSLIYFAKTTKYPHVKSYIQTGGIKQKYQDGSCSKTLAVKKNC